jgi:hypothetical protein
VTRWRGDDNVDNTHVCVSLRVMSQNVRGVNVVNAVIRPVNIFERRSLHKIQNTHIYIIYIHKNITIIKNNHIFRCDGAETSLCETYNASMLS